jgi:heme/copper-type cytochrome/quinol oxidase subunit 2
MADETPVPTVSAAPSGTKTSEFKMAGAVVVLATILQALAVGLLPVFSEASARQPTLIWWSLGVVVASLLAQATAGYSYIKGRATTKAGQAVQPSMVLDLVATVAPFVADMVAKTVREHLAKAAPPAGTQGESVSVEAPTALKTVTTGGVPGLRP